MRTPAEQLIGLDRVVHEPARLAILTALSACRDADFLYLQRLTGCTAGNLSGHLRKLEDAGLISISKGFNGRVPQTNAEITAVGRQAIQRYWQQLQALKASIESWDDG
jgi:DNA-binding MarR family transcriptional regulator